MNSAPSGEAPAPGNLPAPEGNTSYRTGQAFVTVNVPADAKVFVNGMATTSTDTTRQYVSRGLVSGYNYTYEVRVEVTRDGRVVEETKTLNLRAGDNSELAFNMPVKSETTLTLHVPADAKVKLAGNETKGSGPVRVFSTSGLEAGKEWSSYKVVVTLDRNGETLTKEQTVSIQAGESRELRFDFDGDKLADNR